VDIGLLVLRLVVGALLAGHGAQKLFGSFGGHGLAGTGAFFESVGFRPGRPMAVLAGVSELGAGLLLAAGLLNPLAAAAIVGTLLVASSLHWAQGLWAQGGGYELPLVYAVVAGSLAFTGPGAYSLDAAFGLDALAGTGVGVLAVTLGLLSGLAVIVRARRAAQLTAAAAPREERALDEVAA
jgi:putative oxidoreductase